MIKKNVNGNSNHFCLFDSAGKAIQQEAIFAGWGVQVLLYELYNHLITDLQAQIERFLISASLLFSVYQQLYNWVCIFIYKLYLFYHS